VVKSATAVPLVTVLIPTHDHPSTLDLVVASVLRQTIDALDIVIVGDGVTDDTRDVIAGLVTDDRVRFLDTPKSASRAEPVRHMVLTEAVAPYVCYMGDDDLMLAITSNRRYPGCRRLISPILCPCTSIGAAHCEPSPQT